jgi:hypothetical protein
VLFVHGDRVGLREDRADHRRDERLRPARRPQPREAPHEDLDFLALLVSLLLDESARVGLDTTIACSCSWM